MYTMKEACQRANINYETLKLYCNEGLVPNVKRDKNNRPVFNQNNIAWIRSLNCLKNCGMSIPDMKIYLDLCLKGPSSIPQRKVMLLKLQNKLHEQVRLLNDSIEYIEWKQQYYNDVLSGKTTYMSNLINTDI